MVDSSFDCSECESTFRKLKHLKYHKETVHSTERLYKCDQCDNSYKRATHLRRHVQNTHSPLELKCTWEDCDKTFRGQEQLRKHLRRHETKGSFPCGLCGKAFSKKRQLEAHVEKTHGPFHCVICGDKYTSRCEYRVHMASQHPDGLSSVDLPCPYCDDSSNGQIFPNQKELRNHIRESHVKFPCSVCGTSFSRERDLRNHYKLKHMEEVKNFACEICGLHFSSNSNLRVHQRIVHMGVRKFSCKLCDETFAYKHVLDRHVRSIHPDDSCSSDDSEEDPPSPVIRDPIVRPELRTWLVPPSDPLPCDS